MGHCYNSTVVDSSIENTWATMQDFHDMSWAEGVVTSAERIGDIPGTEIGAQRVLNGVFHETLQSVDGANYTFSYSIDDGPGPVASDVVDDYIGTVKLHPVTDTNQTLVVWTSSYKSNQEDAVAELCNPIYRALLAALKAHLAH